MQCTSEQIEEKRRQAQEKLKRKNLISTINQTNSNIVKCGTTISNSTAFKNTFNNHVSPKPFIFKSDGPKSPLNSFRNNAFNSKPYDKPKQTLPFGKNNIITGCCTLISEDRFTVELSGYSLPAIDVFKMIPSRIYNPKTRLWNFHISDYELFLNNVALLQPDVVVGRLPPYVLSCLKTSKRNCATIDLSNIDQELLNSLMPFQEEGVCFGIEKNGRCLIADDMGLGKTFQALAIANYYKSDWPLLIATTASMKNVWEETIHKYMPSISVMDTQYMVSGKDYIGDAKILIVSHDMMTRSLDKLLERQFGILIVDESHTFKNFKTKCTKAATELAKQAKRVILLSGTPALSRPNELYTQLSLLDEKFFGNFFEYSKRYCDGKQTQFGWDSNGKSNLPELEIILAKKFMIRRTKEDVLKSLPNKEQEIVTLDVNLNQFSEADKRSLNALANNYNRKNLKGSEKQAALLTFFAETAKIKIPSVCSYILQTLEQTKKFIVFAHHQIMLDAVQRILVKRNKKFIRIDGSTTSDQRKLFVDKFQLEDDYECAILSITAANAGITLTAAKLVLFAELHWNPSILSQAESRAHRIGQEGKVLVKYLLAPGTADDSIWRLLQNKQDILKEAGLLKDSFQNVPVTNQDLNDTKPIAECLHSDKTVVNTLDISTYFKTPTKNVNSEKDSETKENFHGNTLESVNKGIANVSSAEMEFFDDDFDDMLSVNKDIANVSSAKMELFDDDFDDMLSNIEVNL